MSSPERDSFDNFNERQLRENVYLTSHRPRSDGTYVHMASGTVIARPRLGAVDESPAVSRVRRSLFRDNDPFDDMEDEPSTSQASTNRLNKSSNDSGFGEKYRENSFAYYNRMFFSESSSESDSFDWEEDWEPLELLNKSASDLFEKKSKINKIVQRRAEKRRKASRDISNPPTAKILRSTKNSSASKAPTKKNAQCETNQNVQSRQENSRIQDKSEDSHKDSAKAKFADLVSKFHGAVKLKDVDTSDSENDQSDISELAAHDVGM